LCHARSGGAATPSYVWQEDQALSTHQGSGLGRKPLTFEKWIGKENDPEALEEATQYVMRAITEILEDIRGEKAPTEIFDPHTSSLPRIGNFKKNNRKRGSRL
jgi:hypothetical protein